MQNNYLQVSIGLLGVITEVTFQCEPFFNLVEARKTVPLNICLDDFKSIASSGQHVKLWTEVYTEKCIIYVANRTKENQRDNPNHNFQDLQVLISLHDCLMLPFTPKSKVLTILVAFIAQTKKRT